MAGSQADTLKWCKIYFICYVNANKGSGMGVEKKKVLKNSKKIHVFSFLVFHLILICYKIYLKSCWSFRELTFGMKNGDGP